MEPGVAHRSHLPAGADLFPDDPVLLLYEGALGQSYADARVQTLKAAADLYGAGSVTYNNAANAWAGINVGPRIPAQLAPRPDQQAHCLGARCVCGRGEVRDARGDALR